MSFQKEHQEGITERVPTCALIKEMYSVNRRFLTDGRAESDVYRHHYMIGVDKRAELQSTT